MAGKRHAEGVGAFTGTLATTLQRLKPYDPESKGVVERRNGFFETSFMPGRSFTSPADFDAHGANLCGPAARGLRMPRGLDPVTSTTHLPRQPGRRRPYP